MREVIIERFIKIEYIQVKEELMGLRIYACIYVYGEHFQQSMGQPGMVPNPARGQLNIYIYISCHRSRLIV